MRQRERAAHDLIPASLLITEAERKRIEAKGVSDFQTIVSQSINANLLQWKGIEATENLAKSPNAKIVVIGSGKNGLPVILNPEKN